MPTHYWIASRKADWPTLFIIWKVQRPDEAETPNAETQEAFEELDNGGGHAYNGPVENLISSLLEDESA